MSVKQRRRRDVPAPCVSLGPLFGADQSRNHLLDVGGLASPSVVLADNVNAMTSRPLPAAFAHLIDEPNLAADDALIEVLPDLEPFHQAAALEILIQRGQTPALARVVGAFRGYNELVQRLIAARATDVAPGARLAITSSALEERAGAIEMIAQSDAHRLAYLLADALRTQCSRTRELAAAGLYQMAGKWFARMGQAPAVEDIVALDAQAADLAEAIGTAITQWEVHEQMPVLEAALWLGDRIEPVLRQKLAERHSRIARPLNECLSRVSDPRLAGFVLRALAMPELQTGAARAIRGTGRTAFLRAVLEHGWLLADRRIEVGCREVPDGPWQSEAVSLMHGLEDRALFGAIHFLMATATSPARKRGLLQDLVGSDRAAIRRAVLWQLIQDGSDTATDLLEVMAARTEDGVSAMALREWRRRRPGAAIPATRSEADAVRGANRAIREAFDRLWAHFDNPDTASTAGRIDDPMTQRVDEFTPLLRAKLGSGEALDRARALRLISSLGWTHALADEIHRLAYDPDPIVRSVAVSVLETIPGPTTERLLRAAINDPNDRVEANAVEALDALDVNDRASLLRPKLRSPHRRVRANAIRAMLRSNEPGATDALADMLNDASASTRLSALWVVGEVRPRDLIGRIEAMQDADPDERVRQRAGRVCEVIRSGRPPMEDQGHGLRRATRPAIGVAE